jgi:SMC interacting uncharacterized protein involved in chromosome segregation
MISFENIGLLFQLETLREENNFTQRQKDELLSISSKISNLKSGLRCISSSAKEYKLLESEYIQKFESYNGDIEGFNSRFREFESNSIPYIKQAKEAINGLKNKLRLK